MLLDLLITPFSSPVMMRALLMACCVSVVCALFSAFLVLKGWSLMGDAVSHAVLPGVVLSFVVGIPLSIGAVVSGFVCAIGAGKLSLSSRIKSDAALGILFSGMFALGIVMISLVESDIHLMHILFGNILGVSNANLWETFILSAFVVVIIWCKRKDFLLYCFDAGYAHGIGMSVKVLHYTLLLLLSLVIVIALKNVGIILVIAMLIAPGAIGFLICKNFFNMIIMGMVVALFSSFTGILCSYYFDTAPSPMIIVIQAIIFITCLIIHCTKQNKTLLNKDA